MTLLYGTDNSDYQPAHFPLTDGHTRSSNFAFIKATQGTTYVNPKLVAQVAWARSNGLVVGLYHFLEKGNVPAQIAHFRSAADAVGVYVPGDVIAIDWESYKVSGKTVNVSNADKDNAVKTAQTKFPRSKVVLYCNKDYWTNHDNTEVVGDGLWIAAPGDPDGSPGIQHGWVFQQTGVLNNQDQDVAQFETHAKLVAWSTERVPAVTAPTAFHDVVQYDGIKVPAGVTDDPDGNWTLEHYIRNTYDLANKALQTAEAAVAAIAELKAIIEAAVAK